MREKPWVLIPTLDDTAASEWFATETDALKYQIKHDVVGVIQYRPGRKARVKKKE